MNKNSFLMAGLSSLALLSSSAILQAQNTASTDPVGFVSMDVQPGTVETPTRNLFSISLAGQSVEYMNTIDSVSANVVMLPDSDLEIDDYAATNGPFFLITEDGDIFDIVSNNMDDITLDTSDNISALAGKSFKIYKHQTIASVFGSTPDDILGAASSDDADELLIFNYKTKQFDRFYYKNAPLGINPTVGWVDSLQLTLAEDAIIHPATGFMLLRKDVGALKVTATGGVINNKITVEVDPGNNFVTVPYPVDNQLTLATSGLYDAASFDLSKHFLPAASSDDADRIRIWNGTTYDAYYYKNAQLGINPTIGWVDALTLIAEPDTALPQGQGFIIRRTANQPLRWEFPNVLSTD